MAVDQSDASVIVAALSPERIAPYLRATGGGNLDVAVRLYEWNLAISGALYEALGIVEVVLRNARSGPQKGPVALLVMTMNEMSQKQSP